MDDYPTPNVPNGGRKPKGGMSPTGMTPEGKKRQVGTEQIAQLSAWPKTPAACDGEGGAFDMVRALEEGLNPKAKLRDWALVAAFKTPMANDGERRGSVEPGEKTLNNMAALTGRSTAKSSDGEKSTRTPEGAAKELATRRSIDLPTQAVLLAGWATAAATTWGGSPEAHLERKRKAIANGAKMGLVVSCLDQQVLGVILPLFFVPTGRRVVLAPEFSLWLMGFPEAWVRAAPGAKDWREAQAALASEYSREAETPLSLS